METAESSVGLGDLLPQMANTAECKSENDSVQHIKDRVWLLNMLYLSDKRSAKWL